MDECAGVRCGGDSACVNGENKYTCNCAAGWSGGGDNTVCTPSWITVLEETAGAGCCARSMDYSAMRTLHLINPPFNVSAGNYRVRMEWGSGSSQEFLVPHGRNIFNQRREDILVYEVTGDFLSGTAYFCHACFVFWEMGRFPCGDCPGGE